MSIAKNVALSMIMFSSLMFSHQTLSKSELSSPILSESNPSNSELDQCNDIENEVRVSNICTKIETYKSKKITQSPILVITLHGDAPFGKPSYQYRFAQKIAKNSENVISVGMLRPGYTDDFNRTSDGKRGQSVGDNYDDKSVQQVADAIASLKARYESDKVFLIGHSGGAAIAAKLIALNPLLVNHAFIVSCPCDIKAWRADMYAKSQYDGFKGDLKISSPTDLVSKISNDSQISIYVGDKDEITKPYLSKKYMAELKKFNKKAMLKVIKGNHEILQHRQVIESVISATLNSSQENDSKTLSPNN
ncbi:alpha/beta hydrolase family protein [Aliikangiella coralliicola]|uniref:Serine aminopeptidase S33 domain-containing protein n=1 Tax=Aliikangiella coralliicola TaxID=2592383 RepID=A0A545UC34_9GAMM|nr:alpha/beta hydrolase [Aliikangiella coralliicola]TQV87024.1 hypothetical protein FLL46_14555 [Aliikangiella coralliicola]